jgi:uncharacterized protein (DUF736 family)
MANYETRPNTGALFAVKAKKSPKGPDYTGNMLVDLNTLTVVDGKVEIKISGWKKTAKTGSSFLSLAVDTFVPKAQGEQKPAQQNDEEFF